MLQRREQAPNQLWVAIIALHETSTQEVGATCFALGSKGLGYGLPDLLP